MTVEIDDTENTAVLLPMLHGQQEKGHDDLPATEDKNSVSDLIPDLPTPAKQYLSDAPPNEEPGINELPSVPSKQQEILVVTGLQGKEESSPSEIVSREDLRPTGSPKLALQGEENATSKAYTHISSDSSLGDAVKTLKRRSTSITFEEPKRQNVSQGTRKQPNSLQRFPSGQLLKGQGQRTLKLKPSRTFSMPIPENSLFFTAADASVSKTLLDSEPNEHQMMPAVMQSFTRSTAHSPEPIASRQSDPPPDSSHKYTQSITPTACEPDEDTGENKETSNGIIKEASSSDRDIISGVCDQGRNSARFVIKNLDQSSQPSGCVSQERQVGGMGPLDVSYLHLSCALPIWISLTVLSLSLVDL